MNFIIRLAKILLFWNYRKGRQQKKTQARLDKIRAAKPKQDLVSVLLPVYNVASYLPRCLDSLLSQTYPHLEVICVNDASTDDSLDILQGYATRFPQIKIVNKTANEGLPQARQTALTHASGIWVLHADSDDWLEAAMIEDLYLLAQDGYDMVYCDYFKETAGGQANHETEEIVRNPPILEAGDKLQRIKARSFGYGNTIWNRLVKKEIFEKIEFPVDNAGEDIVLNTQLYYYADRIGYCAKPLYHWRFNADSLTRSLSEQTFDELKANYDRIWAFCWKVFGSKAEELVPSYLKRLKKIHRKP